MMLFWQELTGSGTLPRPAQQAQHILCSRVVDFCSDSTADIIAFGQPTKRDIVYNFFDLLDIVLCRLVISALITRHTVAGTLTFILSNRFRNESFFKLSS